MNLSKQITTTVDALTKTLDAPPLDPVVLALANDYLAGKSVADIAEEYAITQDRVTSVIEKKEVKAYIDSVFATQGYLNRIKRINLINQVIDQKIQEAVETGIYSKKDLLDWMKHLQDIEIGMKPKTAGPAVAVQINNYDKLMKDLMKAGKQGSWTELEKGLQQEVNIHQTTQTAATYLNAEVKETYFNIPQEHHVPVGSWSKSEAHFVIPSTKQQSGCAWIDLYLGEVFKTNGQDEFTDEDLDITLKSRKQIAKRW